MNARTVPELESYPDTSSYPAFRQLRQHLQERIIGQEKLVESLLIEFLLKAKPKDEYLANVKVQIKDAHDKLVLDVTAGGPFLLAKMPAGKYSVSADRNGKVEHRQIEIAANEHRRVVFEWQS